MDARQILTSAAIGAAVLLLGLVLRILIYNSRLPPGPNPIPIIGNFAIPHDFKPSFEKWAKEYGDVMTLRVMGLPILVVNTRAAASELLEKRAAATAGRPHQIMADDLCGLAPDPFRTSDVAMHKQYRRLFNTVLSPRILQRYWPDQIRQMRRCALEIVESPTRYSEFIRRAVAAVSFQVSYGIEIEGEDDPMVKVVKDGLRIVERVVVPGNFLVDIFPFLLYIPSWLPGGGFKTLAEQWNAHFTATRDMPYNAVKADVASGKSNPCLAVLMMEEDASSKEGKYGENMIKWATASVYVVPWGKLTNSVAAIQTFLGAMMLYPEVQAKAHDELDKVVGRDRPPTMEDRDALPYCNAIVKEVLRWQPVTTVGLPHAMMNDEIFNGYLLPKGTNVLPNIWAMTRDEEIFPSPNEFLPERYLNEKGEMLEDAPGRNIPLLFGFGRRICPGWQLAEANLFASFAALLWCSVIAKPNNKKITWLKHIAVNRPHDFDLSAWARFEGALDILRNSIAQ
ncbi:cytochrome P450 [Calocera cornea HHB12733]|uniref:Cytochrome P450 n=1 Tax=Calocera cornea HHB12733 TaxID=1353952 RepID=A0A165GV69_9BASI|nr:cytochrome P450 [Calocera cornea HHB12733]